MKGKILGQGVGIIHQINSQSGKKNKIYGILQKMKH